MCRHAARAIYAWIIVGKRLKIIKDVVGIIAKAIWRTRDQDEWLDSSHVI